jgi:hypothetical protein
MADTYFPTNKLFAAKALAMKGDAHNSELYIGLEEGDMTGFTAATNALTSESVKSGLARAAGTVSIETTTVTGDTTKIIKTFTAAEAITVKGAAVFSAATDGNILMIVVYDPPRSYIPGDIFAVTFNDINEAGV